MRTQLRWLWLAILMIAMLAISATTVASADQKAEDLPGPPVCKGNLTTATEFRPFSEAVWDRDIWERKSPKAATLDSYQHQLRCAAGPHHRHAIKNKWGSDKKSFYRHRGNMLFIQRVTPYYGCTKLGICKWWSLPAYIVSCESGGDYTPDAGLTFGGAYGLLVSTWLQYGGGKYASQANYATPHQQDLIARKIWLDVGSGGWACA